MLRPGFLRLLSDWVSEYYDTHRKEMDAAAAEFNLTALGEHAPDVNALAGVFSEWLVFDRRALIFGGKTGVEYFVEHNPKNVSPTDLAAYRDLLQYKVGMFSIRAIDGGKNVTLADMKGNEYVVHDVTASLHLTEGSVWTRIAKVSGVYQMICCVFIPMPFAFGPGYKKAAATWNDRAMDAREAAKFLSMKSSSPRIPAYESREVCIQKRAAYRAKFEAALRVCGMEKMFTIETYDTWLTNERTFPLGFATKTLFFLIPENVSKSAMDALFDAAMHYGNYVPRPRLKGKCPMEMKQEQGGKPQGLVDQEIYSRDEYIRELEKAHGYMQARDWRKAYDTYVSIMQTLLRERVPTAMAFRIFANAAAACLNERKERIDLAEALIGAALRLNPHYDFAKQIKETDFDMLDDFSILPKGISKRDVPALKRMRIVMKQEGERQYRRTVFRKYEDFLAKCGVSLECKTISSITVLPNERKSLTAQQGRNELCACSSGKKYKKCCGAR